MNFVSSQANPRFVPREDRLEKVVRNPAPTVLVIGGGINGIATYRDLALQGIDVVLVEKGDFCSGASSAPSRMIHGGLRYLEHGEFGLVRESLHERDRLLRNAPHYVSPLPTTVPIFTYFSGLGGALGRFLGWSRKPGRRGALLVKIGLSLYDLLTWRHRIMPRHRFTGRARTRRRWPSLTPAAKCTATYYDAWISYPERLGLEMVQDVASSCENAVALNYVSVAGLQDGGVLLRDMPSGRTFVVRPKVVVNAAGAWVDIVNGAILGGQAPSRRLIGGTKGSHLIVRNQRLLAELGDCMIYYENQEGRVCIMFPYFGNVLVGSTDIRVDDPETVRCEDEERAYIVESLRSVFPDIEVAPEDILYAYSGVRPLPSSDAGTTGAISRDHSVQLLAPEPDRPFPVLCLIGGKWTTFRAFGEVAADAVLQQVKRPRRRFTRDMAIGGGRDYPGSREARDRWLAEVSRGTDLPLQRLSDLLARYGSIAESVANFLVAGRDRPLRHQPSYSLREILWIVRHEDVVSIEDILVRRTSLAISGALDMGTIEEVAAILGEERGWTAERRQAALRETLDALLQRHGLTETNLRSKMKN